MSGQGNPDADLTRSLKALSRLRAMHPMIAALHERVRVAEAKAALAERLLAALKEEHAQCRACEWRNACSVAELIAEAEALGEPNAKR